MVRHPYTAPCDTPFHFQRACEDGKGSANTFTTWDRAFVELIPHSMGLLLLFLFTALGISFLCSVLEAVLLSVPMSFVSMLEKEGRSGAPLLKKYKQNIDKPISAILSLNTIAHTVGATGVGVQSEKVFGEAYFAITSAVLTMLILVLSEILPKTIGASHWRGLAIPAARVIHVLVILTYPFVLMSEVITRVFSKKKQVLSVSREEVSAMVTVGAEEGVFEKKENRMIQNLLKLDDVKARDIMTPSSVVEMAEESMTLREFYQNDAYRTYSRIPVYNEENDDYIRGYVLRQTILEKLTEDKFDNRLSDIVRPVLTFSENEPVSNIWEKLLAKKEHISIIIDEYGCFRGIVTMEDVIETMLGTEIVDEKDKVTDMQEFAREKWQEQQQDALHLDAHPLDASPERSEA